ncbi:ABC transporter ATP-binding protein [Clostridium niameyense]|uniref:ABC transporter ATP-binding protein n=1 Tax=Clostridium niameyense TaxID=1622073 RepID=A0A6M0R6I0_9CLOT|nr:ABC transporter ATP-binding protein [Clostridium niameyense]NEZ45775.1 ABC transporter ATP-binding protein [Clostridium niameyense]
MNLKSEDILEVKNISKAFKVDSKEFKVLNNINFSVRYGEIISFLGPSGCGKSTLLKLIAGLDSEYSGEIIFKGNHIKDPSLERGMIFQEPRLFPWLSVENNVGFGLREDISNIERKKIIDNHLELVGLTKFKNAMPHQLSGGMQQRISIARALVNKPEILLLDEPFGALDAMTRINMQQEILNIWKKENITMILVTHDIEEAILVSDRIMVMSNSPSSIRKVINVDIERMERRNSGKVIEIKNYIYDEFFK